MATSWPRRPSTHRAKGSTWCVHQRHLHRRPVRKQRRGSDFVVLGIISMLAGGWLLWHDWPTQRAHLLGWLSAHLLIGGWGVAGCVLGILAVSAGVRLLRRRVRQATRTRYYARQQSLRALQTMDPLAFERHIAWLFEQEGYHVIGTPRTGDEGIDLWLQHPARGGTIWRTLGGGRERPPIPVQCKRYADGHAVSSPDLQAFSGAMRKALATEGYFVTTSRFTPAAERWAEQEGIHVMDGQALVRWQVRLLPASGPGNAKEASYS